MKLIKSILLLLVTVVLFSCKPTEPPAPYSYEANPNFSWGFADFYGNYYQNYGIENNVVTLNLFTQKLFINEKNQLDGAGQYLIIEDIFSTPNDTLLPAGNYKVAETGKSFMKAGKTGRREMGSIPPGLTVPRNCHDHPVPATRK